MLLIPEWTLAPHLRTLTDRLLEVAAGRLKRLIVSIPPGHGKSTLVSHAFPAWYLGRWPRQKVLLTSYEAHFAASWGRRARQALELLGPRVFGVSVDQQSRRADWWQLVEHGGTMYTAGAGGPLTGKRINGLIIDDPVKDDREAHSGVIREHAWQWFLSTAYTRLEPNGWIVIVMTRWHEDDLVGRILDRQGDQWEVLNLPAISGDGDVLGRQPGEALWPDRFPLEELECRRETMGPYWWSALYQGSPQPDSGGIFKRDWFRYWHWKDSRRQLLDFGGLEVSSVGAPRYAAVDLAASTKEHADWTVVTVWTSMTVEKRQHFVLLDRVRRRVEGPDLVPLLEAIAKEWRLSTIGIESAGMQLALVQQAQRAGLPVREIRSEKDKLSRALAATPAMEQGRVWFPRGAGWLDELERELLTFPHGKHDDQVDSLSWGIAYAPIGPPLPDPERIPDRRGWHREFDDLTGRRGDGWTW